jgi:hypothetical protein
VQPAEGVEIAATNITQGIDAILRKMHQKAPEAGIVLTRFSREMIIWR